MSLNGERSGSITAYLQTYAFLQRDRYDNQNYGTVDKKWYDEWTEDILPELDAL